MCNKEDKIIDIIIRNTSLETLELKNGAKVMYRVIGPQDFMNLVKELEEL